MNKPTGLNLAADTLGNGKTCSSYPPTLVSMARFVGGSSTSSLHVISITSYSGPPPKGEQSPIDDNDEYDGADELVSLANGHGVVSTD
jgi:hypothetical protein